MKTPDMRYSKDWLIARQAEARVKFVFFWGHKKTVDHMTKACLSQWFPAAFTDEKGRQYPAAEHYMMVAKAELFGHDDLVPDILATNDPGKAKALGREVEGFDQKVWNQQRVAIVREANYLKFSQNEDMGSFLKATDGRVLVEASPRDAVWGIGIDEHHEHVENAAYWPGLGLLGFCLMSVRDRLLGKAD